MTEVPARAHARVAHFRPEIQALRAVAIISVLLYHLWPNRVTGGYLGVDVFFVISGFLITSHLLRDSGDGHLSLPRFWARRIRRLLPASLTVLLVTAVAIIAVVPQRLWPQFLQEVIASTLYVQNWLLAANSVDYLAAENEASPVQHFWSLSAEEQFYIAWPILIALALLAWRLAHRRLAVPLDSPSTRAQPRALLFGILLLVTVASLAWAVYSTATDPAPAFFATTTRAWEFGAGSLLAFAPALRVPQALRSAAAWLGWAIIAGSVFVFTDATTHPGLATLVPVAGVVLVIAAGPSSARWSPTWLAGLRPVQFTGDISYSLYLWHWPLIILVPYVTGSALGTRAKLAIIAASVLLAWLSYRFIERPTLGLPLVRRESTRRWFAAALVAAIVLTAVPVSGIVAKNAADAADRATALQLAADNAACFGLAASLDVDRCGTLDAAASPLVPSTDLAPDDVDERTTSCGVNNADSFLEPCHYVGGDGSGASVILVGDSHAKQLTPLVWGLADELDWNVTLLTKGGCPFMEASRDNDPVISAACVPWNDNALDYITEHPADLVITSQRSGVEFFPKGELTSDETAVAGLETTWDAVLATGADIIAVRDNPHPIPDLQACLEQSWPDEPAACDSPEKTALLVDPQVEAAAAFDDGDVYLADFTDLYCPGDTCPAVVGGVNLYRDDDGHVTATAMRTLVPIALSELPAGMLRK